MKLLQAISKSGALILIVAFLLWFLPDLSSVPASGNLFEKLLLTTPVVLALRISFVFVALGIAGFVVAIFWKQIGILKISSTGIEFGKFTETSSKADAELAAKDVIIRDLKAKVESLKKSVQKLSKVSDPKSKG